MVMGMMMTKLVTLQFLIILDAQPQTYGDFFLGSVNEVIFALWSISSHVGVQIGRELVRLITLISLNKFLTNITSPMSLK